MSALQWLANFSIVETIGWTLVHSLWQGFACALLLALTLRATRRQSAATRYILAIAALSLLLTCAIATFTLLMPHATSIIAHDNIGSLPIHPAGKIQPISSTLPNISPQPNPSPMELVRPFLPRLVLIWAIGVIFLALYQFAGWTIIQRIRRRAEPITETFVLSIFVELLDRIRASNATRLMRTAAVQIPTVIGWLHPVILLPINALTNLTTDQLRGLLAHELAHIRRQDYLVNIAQTVVETFFFYHPAVWWIGKVIRQERENACDDLAAAVCDRTTYAQALAIMESLRQTHALALSARGGVLLPRIRRILGLPESRSRRQYSSAVFASIVIAMSAGLILLNPHSSPADQPAHTTSPTTKPGIYFTAPATDDFKVISGDYRISKNDLLSISVSGLEKPDKQTFKQSRVNEGGKIALPRLDDLSIVGNTVAQAQQAIAKAYEDAGLAKAPDVSVTVLEARARTYSILGVVVQPGQYAIPKFDFRLLDALHLAKDVGDPAADVIWVLREDPSNAGEDSKRAIVVPIGMLRTDPDETNIVIRPDDLIVVPPTEAFFAQNSVDSSSRKQPDSSSIQSLTMAIAEVDQYIQKLTKEKNPTDMKITFAKQERDTLSKELAERQQPIQPATKPYIQKTTTTAPASQPAPAAEYWIGGDVPNTGVYSFSHPVVTLLEALTAAGADLQALKDREILVRRRMPDQQSWTSHFRLSSYLNKNSKPFNLLPDDVIEVVVYKEQANDPHRQELLDIVQAKSFALAKLRGEVGANNPQFIKAQNEFSDAIDHLNRYTAEMNKQVGGQDTLTGK
jgi:protein involved in polysaccharide export with SLBB domain/beta-lactamase regulating signal transducer with metallopeptidase domain